MPITPYEKRFYFREIGKKRKKIAEDNDTQNIDLKFSTFSDSYIILVMTSYFNLLFFHLEFGFIRILKL